MNNYHTELVKLLDQYLPKRRDALATHAKKRGNNSNLISTATHASATKLERGDTFTSIARAIGRGLDPEATQKKQVRLGAWYLRFLRHQGFIQWSIARKDSDGQPTYFVELCEDPEFNTMISEASREKRIANITVQPQPWHKPFNRGVPIVKRLTTEDAHEYTIENMPEVYKALNYLQESQWMVNSSILDLMVEGLDGFSPEVVTEEEQQAALAELSTKKRVSLYIQEKKYLKLLEKYSQQSAKKYAKAEAADYFATKGFDYREVVSKHSIMESFIDTVKFAADVEFETLYFQHNLDSRGRVYSLSPSLSPQGNDAQKALLKFACPGPVDWKWVKIHLANCAGQDKLSFTDRIAWATKWEQEIIAAGTDPRSVVATQFFHEIGIYNEKKTKWQFLAACIEYVSALQTGQWSLPIGIDATTSGCQWLSAISRDHTLAEHVNISPCTYAPVGDLYQQVGDIIANQEHDLTCLEGLAPGAKALRKLVKRSVMTYPYSCQAGTMGKHTFSDRKDHGVQQFTDMTFQEATKLGEIQYAAIEEFMPGPASLMKAMQDCFNGYKGSATVSWTTPVGFKAKQHKPVIVKDRIDLDFHEDNERLQLVIYEETNKASVKDHQMGISPNVVHSLDASLMIKSINAMGDAGIVDFHGVHDQFGVLPTHVDLLGHKAREVFYQIVLEDPIEKIMNEAVGNYVSPSKGTWEPTSVLTSQYFLC